MRRVGTVVGLLVVLALAIAPGASARDHLAQVQTRPPAPPSREAPQRDLRIQAFFGKFAGTGLAESEDSAYFGVTVRDLDVTIGPAAGDGFTASWTTVLRQGGIPAQPNVRRRSAMLTFLPTSRPNLYRGVDSGDPLAGKPAVWARIDRSTLYIYEMAVLEDGRYDLQTYARTLSGSGMRLLYTRVRDGERMRTVKGQLVKQAN